MDLGSICPFQFKAGQPFVYATLYKYASVSIPKFSAVFCVGLCFDFNTELQGWEVLQYLT